MSENDKDYKGMIRWLLWLLLLWVSPLIYHARGGTSFCNKFAEATTDGTGTSRISEG